MILAAEILIILVGMVVCYLGIWLAQGCPPLSSVGGVPLRKLPRRTEVKRILGEAEIAALEAEVLEPIEDVIKRIDRELAPRPYVFPTEDRPAITAEILPGGVRATPWSWEVFYSSFKPSCDACSWEVIRTVDGSKLRWVRSDPCAKHRAPVPPYYRVNRSFKGRP